MSRDAPGRLRARLADEGAAILLALQFLTRLPLPADVGWSPARMAASLRWHPLAGAVVGALTAAVHWAALLALPPGPAAVVAVAAALLLTGAFHEDGLADVFDGLGAAPGDRARALEIMRDSRLGTFGAAALVLVLLGRVEGLAAAPAALAPALLVAAGAASRASSVVVVATAAYARDHGTAKPVAEGASRATVAVALATGLAATVPLAVLSPAAAAGALLGVAVGHALMRRLFERRLGGYTGDALGAVQQAGEVGALLGALALI